MRVDRLPYPVDQALAVLKDVRQLVLVGAKVPVSFFAYPGTPTRILKEGSLVLTLAARGDNLAGALVALADELEATALVLRTHMQIADVQQRMTQVGFAALTIFGEKNFNHAMDTIRAQAELRRAAAVPATAPVDAGAERPPAQ